MRIEGAQQLAVLYPSQQCFCWAILCLAMGTFCRTSTIIIHAATIVDKSTGK